MICLSKIDHQEVGESYTKINPGMCFGDICGCFIASQEMIKEREREKWKVILFYNVKLFFLLKTNKQSNF